MSSAPTVTDLIAHLKSMKPADYDTLNTKYQSVAKSTKMNAGDALGECQCCGGLQDCDLNWSTSAKWVCDECHESETEDSEEEAQSTTRYLSRSAAVGDYRQRVKEWEERNKAALNLYKKADERASLQRGMMLALGMPSDVVWAQYPPPKRSDFVKEYYPEPDMSVF